MRERTLPLQGGLPPVAGVVGAVEIACDESGFSGTNLLDAASPVFTHASVDLSIAEARDLVATLPSRFRSSLVEFKSGQFLRGARATGALDSLLAALRDRAHVLVVDKEYFLVTRIVDLFVAEPSYAAGTRLTGQWRPAALALYRARRLAGHDWEVFLTAFVEMLRSKRRREPIGTVVDRFLRARDALGRHALGTEAEDVLDRLRRPSVHAVVARLADDDRSIPPPLEPLLPALAETVLFWSGGVRPVLVVHDEQSALTVGRLRRLQQILADGAGLAAVQVGATTPLGGPSPLAGLVTVDSRDDPRVQVADLLAGFARRSPEVDGPLRPFLSPTSLCDPQR